MGKRKKKKKDGFTGGKQTVGLSIPGQREPQILQKDLQDLGELVSMEGSQLTRTALELKK